MSDSRPSAETQLWIHNPLSSLNRAKPSVSVSHLLGLSYLTETSKIGYDIFGSSSSKGKLMYIERLHLPNILRRVGEACKQPLLEVLGLLFCILGTYM